MVSTRSGFGIGATALLLLFAGCQASQSLEGVWANEGPVPFEVKFNGDGTYEATIKRRILIKTTGTWVYKRPRLLLEVTDIANPDGTPLPISDEQKREAIKKIGDMELSVSWKTDKEIVISGQPPFSGSFRRRSP